MNVNLTDREKRDIILYDIPIGNYIFIYINILLLILWHSRPKETDFGSFILFIIITIHTEYTRTQLPIPGIFM